MARGGAAPVVALVVEGVMAGSWMPTGMSSPVVYVRTD
jgi:hypothetical protein